jgi:hypothetical protein
MELQIDGAYTEKISVSISRKLLTRQELTFFGIAIPSWDATVNLFTNTCSILEVGCVGLNSSLCIMNETHYTDIMLSKEVHTVGAELNLESRLLRPQFDRGVRRFCRSQQFSQQVLLCKFRDCSTGRLGGDRLVVELFVEQVEVVCITQRLYQ